MARILLVAGMLANIPYYHQAWLFEPLIFLLCWTAVTPMQLAITPSPAGCQAGRGSIINPGWQKIARSGRSHTSSFGHLSCNALQNVVGSIAAHNPDFEFANFTIHELAEVAARIDESKGVSGDPVRNADWTGVGSGRAFEARYKEVSARKPRGLKGEEWGRALAAYADEHPNRSDDGSERPCWHEIDVALRSRIATYDFQKKHFGFNPDTFEFIDLRTTRQ